MRLECFYTVILLLHVADGLKGEKDKRGNMYGHIFTDKKFRQAFLILVITAVLANIKSIFNDYNIDSGYAVVMSYRQAKGEVMLSEMLEPHQTSAFLSAILIKVYLMVTGTMTGIVLYLQIAGLIIRGLFTIFFYRAMKPFIRKDILMLMCLFFFLVTPKGLPLPEFSNMQVWFATGLICSLIRYLHEQDKKQWLILAGVFLCLEILAYPSCLIVYAGVVWLLMHYAQNKWGDLLVFTGVCVCIGGLYCGWLLLGLGIDDMLHGIRNVVSGDGSHSAALSDKWLSYFVEGVSISGFLLIVYVFAYIVLRVVEVFLAFTKRKSRKICTRKNTAVLFFLILFVGELLVILSIDMDYYSPLPMYIPIILTGIFYFKYCTKSEQQIFIVGTLIGFLNFFATLMLTNLTVTSSLSYLIPVVMVTFIPVIRGIERLTVLEKRGLQYSLLFIFCGLLIFRSGYLISSMSGPKADLFSLGGIVREGPAIGMVSEYMGPYILDSTMQEWKEQVKDGESVLIVSAEGYDPLLYLFKDVEISNPSTICTPTYDEKLLEYWEKYPEKYPDVIIVECWFGNLKVDEDSWIMQWLEEEYPECKYADGKYWRYYRLEEGSWNMGCWRNHLSHTQVKYSVKGEAKIERPGCKDASDSSLDCAGYTFCNDQ